jgi:hypothetical protein
MKKIDLLQAHRCGVVSVDGWVEGQTQARRVLKVKFRFRIFIARF